jgi:hypothetical protein
MGMAQVSAIQATQFGGSAASAGGGGVPSLATSPGVPVSLQGNSSSSSNSGANGSTLTNPQGVAAQPTQTVNIVMQGGAQLYTADSIRNQLIPALNQAIGDGVVINVTGQ